MITPAYAPTATERVLPRLALDFTTGVLDPRVVVTRALNTATATNSSGYIQTVNADLPRFDYSPTTLASLGLLIEESRANLCLYSDDFRDTASAGSSRPWAYLRCSVTANSVASPSGLVDADTLVEDASAASTHILQQVISKAASSITYTVSVYVKRGSRNYVQLWMTGSAGGTNSARASFDLINGVTGVTGVTGTGWTAGTANISASANGFYRCSFSFTTSTELSVYAWIMPCTSTALSSVFYNGNGSDSLYVWGAQLEAGAFATSYIPTTTTSLTRNADVVSMTGANFSSWYNASEGTLLFEGSIFVDQGSTTVDFSQITNGVSNSNSISLCMFGANAPLFQVVNGTTQANIDPGSITVGSVFKMAGAYKLNSFATAMNGGNSVTDSSGSIPTGMTQLGLGTRLSGPYLNGHARKFLYWNQRITNAEVQAFSK